MVTPGSGERSDGMAGRHLTFFNSLFDPGEEMPPHLKNKQH